MLPPEGEFRLPRLYRCSRKRGNPFNGVLTVYRRRENSPTVNSKEIGPIRK